MILTNGPKIGDPPTPMFEYADEMAQNFRAWASAIGANHPFRHGFTLCAEIWEKEAMKLRMDRRARLAGMEE